MKMIIQINSEKEIIDEDVDATKVFSIVKSA